MKKRKLPSLISILILTVLTSVVWISVSAYLAFTSKPAISVSKEISDPITPTLDQDTMKKIETKLYFDSSQISESAVTLPTPGTTSRPTPTAIPTLSPSPTPTATASATPITI